MASEQCCPKCIFEKEFLVGWDTNGASLDDLWKDAPLWQKQWCVWSASQAVLVEVTGQLLEEHGEERIAPLFQNLPFTDDVFPGKYETCRGEPPTPLTRERVRSTCPLNEATEILLHNRLLRRNIDPLMPRAQQVKVPMQLEGGTEFRVSISCSTEDNSDDTAGTAGPPPAAAFTPSSAAAVLPPAAAFTPSSAAAAAIDAAAEGTIDDAFATAAAAGIAYDPFKKEDAATNAFDATSVSADLFDASAASGCTGCAAVYDLYFKYTGEEEETHPYLYHNNIKPSSSLYNNNIKPSSSLYNNNDKPSSSLYNNNNKPSSSLYNNNRPSSSIYDNNIKPSSYLYNNNNRPSPSVYSNNNNKPSSSLYNNNDMPSSFYRNINDPRLVGFLANKMQSKKRKRNELQDDGFYLKKLRYDNNPSCSLNDNNTKPSSSLYNSSNDPRLAGFSAHKMESKKRERNELQDDGFYLKRLRYD